MPAAAQGATGSDIGRVPGWYGKLPSLGDFASRRLEGDFIEPWDVWLGERIQALRDARGDSWLEAYLHSPPWRFLLTPGTLPGFDRHRTLAGVLLPSVDRVGRYFPITLVAALPRVPTAASALAALLAWMQRLEDAALDAVQGGWDIDALESALAGLPPPAEDAVGPDRDPLDAARRGLAAAIVDRRGSIELAPAAGRQDLAELLASGMSPDAPPSSSPAGAGSALRGIGLWLADRTDGQRLIVSEGLPAAHDFFMMFGAAGGVPSEPPPVLIPEDADLLGLFDGRPAAEPPSAPSAPPLAGSDVLGLFAVPAPAAAATPPGDDDTRPGDDDILALFGALPSEAVVPAPSAKNPAEPDILDLFGAAPGDEAKPI